MEDISKFVMYVYTFTTYSASLLYISIKTTFSKYLKNFTIFEKFHIKTDGKFED